MTRHALRAFAAHAGAERDVASIAAVDVRAFLATRLDGHSPPSVANYRTGLRVFVRRPLAEEYIDRDPTATTVTRCRDCAVSESPLERSRWRAMIGRSLGSSVRPVAPCRCRSCAETGGAFA